MKYYDKHTLKIQSKNQQKEVDNYGFLPFESCRELRRRRKKELHQFWIKYLKNHISEDFWNALEIDEQSSVSQEFRHFEGDIKDYVKSVREIYKDKLIIARDKILDRVLKG